MKCPSSNAPAERNSSRTSFGVMAVLSCVSAFGRLARRRQDHTEWQSRCVSLPGVAYAWSAHAILSDVSQPPRQLRQRRKFGEARMLGWQWRILVGPDQMEGDECRVAAGFQRRQHVGAHGVAGHGSVLRAGAVAREGAGVGFGLLLADDLYAREETAETGGCEL